MAQPKARNMRRRKVMLTSDLVCMGAGHSGNNSYNKRLKALEAAIASYSTIVASKTISGDEGKFTNAEVTNTATINKETVEQSEIQDLNAKHIDNRDGFAALGQVTVKSLQIEGDEGITSTFKTLTADNANITNANVEDAEIKKAKISNLEVTNVIDNLNLKKVQINGNTALSSEQLKLLIAESFNNADFRSALRPSWQGKSLALQEDTSTVFRLVGIISNASELPENADNGDCYFIRSYTDGALTGPAVAAYVNNDWGYVMYPGLDDYINRADFTEWTDNNYNVFVTNVMSYLDVFVPVTDKTDFTENPDNYRIKGLYDSITEVEHQLNDNAAEGEAATYKDFREATEEFIQTTYPEDKSALEAEIADKVSDPESNGEYLRKKTNDGGTSWVKLDENEAFVNKTYSEVEVVKSQITNDVNGIRLDSAIKVEVSTPEEKEETTQEVVNVEYLRNNLSLSKEASSTDSKSELFYEEKGIMPESEHLYITTTYGNENVWWSMKRLPDNYTAATKDYRYYRLTNYASNEANTYTFFFSVDRNGTVHKINQVDDGYLNQEAQASVHGSFITYSPDAWNGETDNVAYYMFPRALYNSINQGYINVYKDGRFYGRVKDADENEFGIYTALDNPNPSYYRWGGKTLRNAENPRALVVNDSSNATDQLKAYLIGVDGNGEEGIDRGKALALPAKITWGPSGLAAGKNYFWFQNNVSNIFSRVDKDGNIASYTLVDPVAQTALASAGLRNEPYNFIELENGDVIFYVSNLASGLGYDYFIYCSDDPTEAAPVTVYRSAVKFSNVESNTDRWPLAARYPFVECGNYVYFFASNGFATVDGGSVMGNGNAAYWKSVANQYARFDKTSKSWSYTQVPWTIGNYAVYGPAQHLITKDGYLWVFPNQISDATINGSQVLVISPTGQATTVDLGTGSSVNFFYSSDFTNGWSCYLNQSGTAAWAYARQPNTFAAVNSHGLGCLVSTDFKHILLFKGNGEFHHYDYSSGQNGPLPQGFGAWRGGPSLIPCKDGFLLGFYHSTNYRMSANPEAEAEGVIYISTTGDDINIEPTFKMFETNEGNGLFIKYYEAYPNNMTYENYEKRFRLMSEVRMHTCEVEQALGLAIWRETSTANGGKIYLKDGDYEISDVEI